MNPYNDLSIAELGQSSTIGGRAASPGGIDAKLVASQWREAIENHRNRLREVSDADYERTMKSVGPFELWKDLMEKGKEESKPWLKNDVQSFASILRAISTASLLFVSTMRPLDVSVAIIWSFLNLYIDVSQDSASKWSDFMGKLKEIQSALIMLNLHKDWIDSHPSHEVSEAIYGVFDNLLGLWTKAIVWMRRHKSITLGPESWKEINSDFHVAMNHVRESVNYLEAIIRRDRNGEHQVQTDTERFSQLTFQSDAIQYPRTELPYPPYRGFFGRQTVIESISTALRPNKDIFGIRSVLLLGIGGVGKTQTALTYAHQTKDFDAVFWARSETKADLQSSFTKIANNLELPGRKAEGSDGDEENHVLCEQWFKAQEADRFGRTWLLVFDNCEDLSMIYPKYIPKTRGSILITSRISSTQLPDTQVIPLTSFDVQEGCALFRQLLTGRVLSPSEDRYLQELVELVGGLPLAIRVLAGLMNDRLSYSVEKFADIYKKNPRKLLKKADRVNDYDHDENRKDDNVFDNVWLLSFENLRSNEEEYVLLGLLSLMASEEIFVDLFDCRVQNTAGIQLPSICSDKIEFEEAMIGLEKLGFLIPQAPQSDGPKEITELSLHRLIQDSFVNTRERPELDTIFACATTILSLSFPQIPESSGSYESLRRQCNRVVPHVLSLIQRFKECATIHSDIARPKTLGPLIWRSAWFLYEHGQYSSALEVVQTGVKYYAIEGSFLYADLLNTLCCIYIECNDLLKARSAIAEAMVVRNALVQDGEVGAKSQLAAQLMNLGNIAVAESNYGEAFDCFEQCGTIRKELNSPASLMPIIYLNHGRALFRNGDNSLAVEKLTAAGDIFTAEFGSASTWMAFVYYQFGTLEVSKGNQNKGRNLFLRARDIWLEIAPHHLALSACYYKLAVLDRLDGEYQSALSDIKSGLTITNLQEAYGDEARLLWEQAKIYECQGETAMSEDIKFKAWNIRRKLRKQNSDQEMDLLDATWDELVCIYWR